MNYEQKYKEALEKARKLCAYPTTKPFISDLQDLFPELEESENERVREELIDFVKSRLAGFPQCEKYIAWLEKQGNNADKVKQQQAIEIPFGTKDSELQEATYYIPDGYHAEINGNEVIIKQGEQKTIDKVEQIFEVGNWVVANEKKYTFLVKRGAPRYQVEDTNGDIYSFYLLPNGEEEYHLWTFKDAKEGDVLHSPSHHLIWIYKDSEHYYVCVNMNYTTQNIATNGLIGIPKDVYPATKDEQTILFERMKEAGYEWDADKKELIKL